jgi:hypothetical protein
MSYTEEQQSVSYKVIATGRDGKTAMYNYVDDVEYTPHGTVILKGNTQAQDGTMIRRDFVLERGSIHGLEMRVIKK